jgi:acyl-CoA synthetase (AMP-forming)/AMP-acid ligase II
VTSDLNATVSGTVAAAFARTCASFPGHDWLTILPETARSYGIEARTWSYREAQVQIERLAAQYAAAGYGHGHRAGLLLLNRPEFLFHWLALNRLGVSVVPINPDWRSAELEYLIGHSEIAVAACLPERAAELAAAARAAGRKLALTAPDGGVLERADAAAPHAQRSPDVRTECALLYTSGTTGRPKGCILPNEYFLWAGTWYAGIGGLCEVRPGRDRMITPLPMTHMNAMAYSAMCMLLTGGCLVLMDRFHPGSWWDSVRASHATIIHYLGVMPAMLLGAPPSPDDARHDVRFGFGAGVNPRHHASFEQRFGFPLLEAWAMTETGAGAVMIANREPRDVGTACFGRAEPRVECRIVGDDGRDVPAGAPGELLVRRAGARPRFGFFAGYLKDEVASAAAWEGGWFHTGDLVTRDASGMFRFVDRKKNVIRRSGENISAVEVESVVAQHPAVAAVGVTAVPDELRGDEVFACVVPRAGYAAQESLAREIAAACRARLAYFKAPAYIAFCDVLPLTPTEKIQRADLKALARRLLEQRRCFDLTMMKRRES